MTHTASDKPRNGPTPTAVVGDGAGLCAVLAAKQLGAERIIAMSRHPSRQKLALEFGATDIVTERGEAGVARIKEMTRGLGAHSVTEAVGSSEAMMQAIRSTRPGGHVGYVGVPRDQNIIYGVMRRAAQLRAIKPVLFPSVPQAWR